MWTVIVSPSAETVVTLLPPPTRHFPRVNRLA
jgi:hypothetical protein